MIDKLMIAAIFLSGQALAADPWQAQALAPLTVVETKEADAARLTVSARRDDVLDQIPLLQSHGALPPDLTAAEAQAHPAFAANIVALRLAALLVQDRYAHDPQLQATRWTVKLSADGDPASREAFSFAFDRARYETMPWDRLTPGDFPLAAKRFSYNLRFTLQMSREVSGSIDDD